jgi:SAM-dependent methyltransferase
MSPDPRSLPPLEVADTLELRPVPPPIETAGIEHPSRPVPTAPPADPSVRQWAEQLDVAADAWRPELERVITRLGLRAGSRVLDAGCGPGRITGWLAERVAPGGLVNGVDVDLGALEYAAWHLGRLDVPGISVELGLSSVEALPFEPDTFDAAWCSGVLAYVDDPALALRELARVVRPEGSIVVITGDAARATWLPIAPELEAEIRRAELRAIGAGTWGAADVHLGRRLYAMARELPVTSVQPTTIVWERTAPLGEAESAYLHHAMAWLADEDSHGWLGDAWEASRRLLDPRDDQCVLWRDDLHVVQTTTAVIITV